jgi:DNA-binding transcriptional LysR family regulator
MDIDQLEAFLLVAKTRSFTQSAELLHVVQSTVTSRVQMLEKYLGTPLFKRTSRKIQLTPAGKKFLPYAQRIVELTREGKTALLSEGNFESHLVIGSPHSMWNDILYPSFRRFQSKHPEVFLRLVTDHSREILEKMIDGLIDVGIVYIPPHHTALETELLYQDDIQLVAHPSLSIREPVRPEDWPNLPYIHLDWGGPFTDWFRQTVGEHYLPAMQVDHVTLLLQSITAGEGIGFVTDTILRNRVVRGEWKRVKMELHIPVPKRTVYLVYPKRKKGEPHLGKILVHIKKELVKESGSSRS